MFPALFIDHHRHWCRRKKQSHCVPQDFDCTINCHDGCYVIEKVKGCYDRVIAIRIVKSHDACFETIQQFSACQFCGAFFANIRRDNRHHGGTMDIVADVYDADSFPVGTLILINNCNTSRHSDHEHTRVSFDPCAASHQPHHHHKPYTLSDNCIHLHTW